MEMITLNLIPKGIPPVCHASQYDKGRVIRCNLVDGLQGYVLSGETAVLNVIKPDNNIVTEALTATTGNTYIDIITTEQMCAVAGKNECEIRLTKGEVEVGTLNFIMQVEEDVTTGGIESETVIHDLKTTISDMVKEEIEAISPEEELSGAMASFETHEIAPLVDCKVKIEAIQSGSGTPSPDNVRPITGFTECNVFVSGVNLWDEQWEVGYISVADGQNSPSQVNIRSKNYIPIKPNISLYLKANINFYCPIIFYDKDKNFLLSIAQTLWNRTITTPENAYYMRFYMHDSYGTTYNNDISINYPSSDTQYHSYNGNTYTVDFGQTVYGGSLDVTTGVLTVTYAKLSLEVDNMNNQENYPGWQNCGIGAIVGLGKNQNFTDCMLNVGDNFNANTAGGADTLFLSIANYGLTQSEWKSTYAGLTVDIIARLATPVTYQLTPTEIKTILGVNNIWADTGDIDVVYHHELTARYVYFDNTGTDLTATNVEAAIKELWSRLQ